VTSKNSGYGLPAKDKNTIERGTSGGWTFIRLGLVVIALVAVFGVALGMQH
jgi:hypothetical protein